MEEEEKLEMGIFDDIGPLDLELDPVNLEELEKETSEDAKPEEEEDTPPEEVKKFLEEDDKEDDKKQLSEGEDDSEKVAEEEEGAEGDKDSPELFSSFAEVLAEQGLLPSANLQDKEVKTVDDLTTLLKEEINNQVKDYLVEKVGEQGYEALEKGVSLSEYQQYNTDLQTLDKINEDTLKENPELAKEVILQDYIAQGLSQAKAERLLEKIIDLGDESLLEDATESLSSLKAIQERKLQEIAIQREKEQIEAQRRVEKIDNDLKNAVYNSEEYVKGLGKVDKSIQDRVYKSITNVVGKSPQGVAENKLMQHRRENPIEFDVKLYYLYEMTNGFEDFSKINKASETKAADKLAKVLRKTKFDTSGAPTYAQDDQSYDGVLGDELVL